MPEHFSPESGWPHPQLTGARDAPTRAKSTFHIRPFRSGTGMVAGLKKCLTRPPGGGKLSSPGSLYMPEVYFAGTFPYLHGVKLSLPPQVICYHLAHFRGLTPPTFPYTLVQRPTAALLSSRKSAHEHLTQPPRRSRNSRCSSGRDGCGRRGAEEALYGRPL